MENYPCKYKYFIVPVIRIISGALSNLNVRLLPEPVEKP